MGFATTASGTDATAMGNNTTAASGNSLSIGSFNSANTSADGTLFAAGNGSFGSPSDALVLDQGGNLTISGTLTESSDRRLKTSIRPLNSETLAKLSRLRPVRYEFKNQETHPSGEQIGLVAQEVRNEFPALVSGGADDALSLSYSKLGAVLLKGLQEQQAEHATYRIQQVDVDGSRTLSDPVEVSRSVPSDVPPFGAAPHPVQQHANVVCTLPNRTDVRLEIYDVLVRRVATLVNETQSAGRKTYSLTARDLASGTYLLVLSADDKQRTERFTIVR
jgi:hypothetical protein